MSTVHVPVRELGRSRAFYRRLGLHEASASSTRAVLRAGPVAFVFEEADADTTERTVASQDHPWVIQASREDAAVLRERLERRGYPVASLAARGSFAFRDPDGYTVAVVATP